MMESNIAALHLRELCAQQSEKFISAATAASTGPGSCALFGFLTDRIVDTAPPNLPYKSSDPALF